MQSSNLTYLFMSVLVLHVTTTFILSAKGSSYYRARYDKTCPVLAEERSTVDLLCFHDDKGGHGQPSCRLQSFLWQKMGMVGNKVLDAVSVNSAVWYSDDSWGLGPGKHASVLRINEVRPEDVGTYLCEIECIGENNIKSRGNYYIDLCLQQPNADYGICSPITRGRRSCLHSFKNEICDFYCADKHLFDGFDCEKKVEPCKPPGDIGDAYCAARFANGVCDTDCNSNSCASDGGDCLGIESNYADDVLVLYIRKEGWPANPAAAVDLKEVGRSLSLLLRTIVKVMPDDWYGHPSFESRGSKLPRNSNHAYHDEYRLFLKIDNAACPEKCFRKAAHAAEFITASLDKNWNPGIPISAVGVLSDDKRSACPLENRTLLHTDIDLLASKVFTSGNSDTYSFHSWIVIASILAGACLLVLVISLIFVACRRRKTPQNSLNSTPEVKKKYPSLSKYDEAERIPALNYHGHGADV